MSRSFPRALVSVIAVATLAVSVLLPVSAAGAAENGPADTGSIPEVAPLLLGTSPGAQFDRLQALALPEQEQDAPDPFGAYVDGEAVDLDSHERLEGVEVWALELNESGDVLSETMQTTNADGHYYFEGLNEGWYDFYFVYEWPDTGERVVVYYENQPVYVSRFADNIFHGVIPRNGTVSGTLSCGACVGTFDPTRFALVLAAYEPATERYLVIGEAKADLDGSFDFVDVHSRTPVAVFALDQGQDGVFVHQSNSIPFDLPNGGEVNDVSVIAARAIQPVSGMYPAVNSVVNALYFDFLSRFPSANEVKHWGTLLQNGANPGIVSAGFVNSDEYRLIRINAAYRDILGRAGEQSGVMSWLNAMRAGVITTDDIERNFYASQEFYVAHGGTNTSYAQALYEILLHRKGTNTDYKFWADLVAKHGRAWVISQFWDSTETISERIALMYEKYLGRRPDPQGLNSWVALSLQIGDSGLRAGLSGSDEYIIRAQYRIREE